MSHRQEGARPGSRRARSSRNVSRHASRTSDAIRRATNPVFERLEDRQLLAAVSTGTFLAGQRSGIPVSSTDLINGLVPAPADTNYVRTFEGGPIDNLTNGR